MKRRKLCMFAGGGVIAILGANDVAFARAAVIGMEKVTITTPGDGSWPVPKGVTSVIVFAVGGGGGGGNVREHGGGFGENGGTTSFNGIDICLGAPGGKSFSGGFDDVWYHTKGGDAQRNGESTSEFSGGLYGTHDTHYPGAAEGGGGGASTYGPGGGGGTAKPDYRHGFAAFGYGSGGGGAYGALKGIGGGGGGGCQEQAKVLQIAKGTSSIPYHVGSGGEGAQAVPNRVDPGGSGSPGLLTIYYCAC